MFAVPVPRLERNSPAWSRTKSRFRRRGGSATRAETVVTVADLVPPPPRSRVVRRARPKGSPLPELPRGTVTFLFTDIEGSTRLLAQLRERYGDVLATHHRLLREAIGDAGGEEVGTEG